MGKHLFIGIDLSTYPNKTGTCILKLDDDKLTIESSPTILGSGGSNPNRVVEMLTSFVINCEKLNKDHPVILAIDIPFGWPIGFQQWLPLHSALKIKHPALSQDEYLFRRTEQRLRARTTNRIDAKSVVMNNFASTAIMAIRLRERLRDYTVNLFGNHKHTNKSLIEVYPAASLASWGSHNISTNAALERLRSKVTKLIQSRFNLHVSPKDIGSTIDGFHALVCALTAYEWLRGNCEEPNESEYSKATIETEGWIWVPKS